VVADGETAVEPLAVEDVNPPGLIAMLVAPLVAQFSVLLAPALILAGLAVKEVIVGSVVGATTVTVAAAVTEPALLVAVSVYAVVTDGDTLVEPLAAADVNPPGLIAILVAPLVLQLSELLVPAVMLEGLAENPLIVGTMSGFAGGGFVTPAQLARSMAKTTRARRARRWSCSEARNASRAEMPQRLSCSRLAHTAMPTSLRAFGAGSLLVKGTGLVHCRGAVT
jgi:hypothetical protein